MELVRATHIPQGSSMFGCQTVGSLNCGSYFILIPHMLYCLYNTSGQERFTWMQLNGATFELEWGVRVHVTYTG
jgi:hypothetical protein